VFNSLNQSEKIIMEEISERARFAEDFGLLFENMGATRMSGRIFGYVAVSDAGYVSFNELVEALSASKSTISTNLRSLVQMGFLKPITFPTDRRTYYGLASDISWAGIMRKRLRLLEELLKLFNKGLEIRGNGEDVSSRWLRQSISFYDFVLNNFPKMMEEWEKQQKLEM
jgi:DNA-binding transcriptional regulator GbsR (MarR family)